MARPPSLTDKQRKTYEVLQKIRMAWVVLWFVLCLFSAGFIAFLWSLFVLPSDALAKSALGGTNFLLGWAMKAVVRYLFPGSRRK